MSGDILDLIDNALEDWSSSPDAMRWRPEGGEAGVPRLADWEREAADIERYGAPPTWRPGIDVLPDWREGDLVTVDGQEWRVLQRVRSEDSVGWTYYLGPVELPIIPVIDGPLQDSPHMISRPRQMFDYPVHRNCYSSLIGPVI